MKYPLIAFNSIPESSKFPGYTMSGPDLYHEKSRMSLAEHIEEAKSFLQITYCSGNYHDEDQPEEKQISAFVEEYKSAFQALKGGQNATSCEELITMKLGAAFQSDKLQGCFSTSMTWVLCTELLYQSEYKENAWSTLVEYKKSELETEIALDEENRLSLTNQKKTAGKQSYIRYHNLKVSLLELLITEKPPEGWIYKKQAVNELATKVHDRHIESIHSSKYRIDVDKVAAKLNTWLTTDPVCKDLFAAHKKKS